MPNYSCEKCGRIFKQKSHYTDHVNKKTDCSQNTVITTVIEKQVEQKVKEVVRSLTQPREITKESLPSFFEDLHNLLWNKAGLNPEAALQHMIFFFAYRLIEIQADNLNLPQECRWSYIASIKNENDLFEAIKKGVSSFRSKPKTKPFFKPHEIQKADIVYDIVQQINRVSLTTLQETDTLGDIFEYMLSRGMSTMSDEGQYYTNREICKLAFKLAYEIKQTLRRADGSLCTFADWFVGTGGFPAEYIRGIKENLPDIDWKRDSSSIYCQDMNTSSVTITLLNLLILTGVPFGTERIRSTNSFADPITKGISAPFHGLEIDYCFMNPPYGGDKTKGKEYKFSYSKTVKDAEGNSSKKFFVNEDIQSIGIEDDDKVSAGVQLAMATLANEGVCCIVLPQGFFFGATKKTVELRKKLAETYKIHFVVDIASGAFVNTGTKTSMLVFQKGVGPTEKVNFVSLDDKTLAEATLTELRGKNYSLNYKQYVLQEAVDVEGFEMMKLKDVIEIENGEYITKATTERGEYPSYGGGDASYTLNKFNRENKFVINKDGMSKQCIRYVAGKFWLNHHGWTFNSKNKNKITETYVGHWLLQNQEKVYNLGDGTAQKGMKMGDFLELQIPLPCLERQQEIVAAIDVWNDFARREEEMLAMLEKQIMFYVKEIGRGKERVKLGDVCEIKCGKSLPKTEIVEGEYPAIGGGISPMAYHNTFTNEAYTPLISQRGENSGYVSRYPSKCWITSNAVIPSLKNNTLISNLDFLYYLLKVNEEQFYNIVVKTAQPMLTVGNLLQIEIKIPSLTEQQTLQSDFDEIRHKHAKIAEYKAKAQEAIKRLIPGA